MATKRSNSYWLGVAIQTILLPTLLAIFLDACGVFSYAYAWYTGIDELPVLNQMKKDVLTGAKAFGQEYAPKLEEFYASVARGVDKVQNQNKVRGTRRYWKESEVEAQLLATLPRGKRGNMEAYLRYIEEYKDEAILEMRRTGIPASITLAQGLLESDAGRSRLARMAKNHFGIKCRPRDGFRRDGIINSEDFVAHSMCVGCLQAHDDVWWDRFEMYESPADSYRRHSILLCGNRYGWMIQKYRIGAMCNIPREIYDRDYVPYYAAWAVGLKDSGYATYRAYAEKVTLIIEYYQLYLVDYEGMQVWITLFSQTIQ